MTGRKSGRHPDAKDVVVRLTDDALDDLKRLQRKGDPPVVRWVLKKFLLLERDPEAGAELCGGRIGFRKLAVGDRDWRLVWRVTPDDVGRVLVAWQKSGRSVLAVTTRCTRRSRIE